VKLGAALGHLPAREESGFSQEAISALVRTFVSTEFSLSVFVNRTVNSTSEKRRGEFAEGSPGPPRQSLFARDGLSSALVRGAGSNRWRGDPGLKSAWCFDDGSSERTEFAMRSRAVSALILKAFDGRSK
jgi:hypothetical protein